MIKRRLTAPIALCAAAVVAVVALVATAPLAQRPSTAGGTLASNPNLDPGTPMSHPAPDFTLTDQFGQSVSLRSFRGKVVILAFNDSECTTVCPLTTTAMVDAKRYLGSAGSRVQLLGVDANPQATAIKDVRAYSRTHGMLYQWHFLTGSLPQLQRVWTAYSIAVEIAQGQIDHTPALFVIDPEGRVRKLYMTQMSYASVPQLGQLLAAEAASLLPGRPRVHSSLSYAQVPSIGPSRTTALPGAGGGTVGLGPGDGPQLLLFFAAWDSENFPDLGRQLEALNGYSVARGLPRLTAVDEASVDPSVGALTAFVRRVARPLSFPVAIDHRGQLADGYQVQDLPWFVLTSGAGRLLWYYDVSTQGWLSRSQLTDHVRAALSRSPKVTLPTAAAVPSALAGSPGPLAALHQQASRLLGSSGGLRARLRALRGYPIVINAWASWCTPCQREFPLFAAASVRYGHLVAFLGADTNDSAGNAQAFLAKHPVSYPSYQSTSAQLAPWASIEGLPTTIYINRAGKVVGVHTGQYDAQGSLDADIASYALGG
jgi:cytochrome oxidase Cu insertion factor (SCO1/SenC/PrrC family)/thiol-disulfide isomerase/thioredoxin